MKYEKLSIKFNVELPADGKKFYLEKVDHMNHCIVKNNFHNSNSQFSSIQIVATVKIYHVKKKKSLFVDRYCTRIFSINLIKVFWFCKKKKILLFVRFFSNFSIFKNMSG